MSNNLIDHDESGFDKVIISDLLVRGIIGINEWERKKIQDILINIVIYTDMRRAAKTDKIIDCVNYRDITKKVISLTENANRFTVEALASDIARLVLEDDNVHRVHVRVEKPGAVRFAKSVGVEIERSKY
ncbi:MAG: dihydroneopterin aldolase [Anaerolineales bacterium]|jgi:FolB domain-containing protein